jgi:hypothetical protein
MDYTTSPSLVFALLGPSSSPLSSSRTSRKKDRRRRVGAKERVREGDRETHIERERVGREKERERETEQEQKREGGSPAKCLYLMFLPPIQTLFGRSGQHHDNHACLNRSRGRNRD